MVYTSVTIDGVTHDMWLPVMDGANKAMKPKEYDYSVKNPNFRYAKWNEQKKQYLDSYGNEQPEYIQKHVDAASMMDINKTIMRCLVKNLAMFGLGLYIYAGEDLPETERNEEEPVRNVVPANSDVTVTMQQTVPNPVPETPSKFLLRKIGEFSKQYGKAFDFLKVRGELIAAGKVNDVPSATMKMEDAQELVAAIEAEMRKAG